MSILINLNLPHILAYSYTRYTCQECIDGLEWVEAYMNDPLWVAEYTLYLEENFCPTQIGTER